MMATGLAALTFGSSIPKDAVGSEVFPTFEKPDESKYFCGNCCGWDIYCNKRDNPFVRENDSVQTLAGVPNGELQGMKHKDPAIDPKYLCFYCCNRYWYCNK